MTYTFYLLILMMGSGLFSACDSDNKLRTTVSPPDIEEKPNDPNQPSGEMGDPSQTNIYLWLDGNREGVDIKGAVLICPGGAFQFRSQSEGEPVTRALSELGYQSFVVNYRLRPYTQQEGALDLARAVKFVHQHADYYGINPDNLDNVSADVKAIGHIYSFYGRLSVASTDVGLFGRSNLPPTFFCYGTEDPFTRQFAACVDALRQANVSVETHVLEGWPHGYGSRGNWIPVFDRWLTGVFDEYEL